MKRLTVSVVSYNTRDLLRKCLSALERETRNLDVEIIVVDNASIDGSAAMVASEFPGATLIQSGLNLGFAGGNNVALRSAASEYVLVLNPDVEAEPGSVTALLRWLDEHKHVAAVSPMLRGPDGSRHQYLYRRFPTISQILMFWSAAAVLFRGIGPLRRRVLEHDLRGSGAVSVDQLPGAALLVRTEVLRQVGPFDADYFIWFEDVDWSYRARAEKHTLMVLRDVHMRHEGGASFAAWDTEARVHQFHLAFTRFLCKHDLHRLRSLAVPILMLDLRLKELALGLRARIGSRDRRPPSFRTTRRQMKDVVRRHRQGSLVSLLPDGNPDTHVTAFNDWPKPVAVATNVAVDRGTVDAIIVNWNGREYLPRCIAALKSSTVPVNIVVVDNASADGSVDYLRSSHHDVRVIALDRNAGYAGGANAGLNATGGEYALLLNPDVAVDPDHIALLRRHFAAHPGVGAGQGKLYSVTPQEFVGGCLQAGGVLDSAGHVIRRSRMVVDRGQGCLDGRDYDEPAAIFSACGAALFLRRSMLNDLAPDGAYFAEEFFAYKEDIDLGWRARLLGWDIHYVPGAVAHHVRTVPLSAKGWQELSAGARRHSWKNHYLLMVRNDRVRDLLLSLPWVVSFEVLRLGHALLREPRVLAAYGDAAKAFHQALRERRVIMSRRRAADSHLRQWFGASPRPLDLTEENRRRGPS